MVLAALVLLSLGCESLYRKNYVYIHVTNRSLDAFSPDGRAMLAVGDTTYYAWLEHGGRQLAFGIERPEDSVRAVVYLTNNHPVSDPEANERKVTVEVREGPLLTFYASSDDSLVAVTCDNNP